MVSIDRGIRGLPEIVLRKQQLSNTQAVYFEAPQLVSQREPLGEQEWLTLSKGNAFFQQIQSSTP